MPAKRTVEVDIEHASQSVLPEVTLFLHVHCYQKCVSNVIEVVRNDFCSSCATQQTLLLTLMWSFAEEARVKK